MDSDVGQTPAGRTRAELAVAQRLPASGLLAAQST